jgi:hypothetical protein
MASVGKSGPWPENVAEIPSEPEEPVDIDARLVCCASSTGTHIRSEEQARTRRDHVSDAAQDEGSCL